MKFPKGFKWDPLNVVETMAGILGERDTTAKTREMLQQMDYPNIRDLMPFQDYDSDNQLWVNSNSLGFVIESQPLIGANEKLAESLESVVRDSVPRELPLQVMLVSSRAIKHQVTDGLKNFAWKGHRADECNDITERFYLNGTRTTFNNGLDHPLTLRDYRLFFIWSLPVKNPTETEFIRVRDVRRNLLNALNAADIWSAVVGIENFNGVLREFFNHDAGRLDDYHTPYDPSADLRTQFVDRTTSWLVKPSHIRIEGTDRHERPFSTRMVNLNLDRNPQEHYLWQNGNIIQDLTSPTNGIPCPFIFTMVLVTEEQVKSQGEANTRFLALDSRVNTSYAKYIPSTKRQHAEWKEAREELLANRTSLTSYFLGVTLFCPDDDDETSRITEKTRNAFAAQGMQFIRADFMQLRNVMATIPFRMMEKKLFADCKKTGAIQRAETFHAVNLAPVIGDNKLCRSGILIPSYRNQVAFIDVFDESLPNTNFNFFMSGTSGAGKSVLSNSIARSVLETGGTVAVQDIGDSYKAACSSLGGTYINGESLRFNPFANVTNITLSAERIRDQLCILASPNGLLDEVHESLILEAITESWPTHQQDMRIDHVVAYLKKRQADIGKEFSPQIAGRIDEITTLLNKYCINGIYGQFFNSSEPTLKNDLQFVVTELGDLRKQSDLLSAVLFTIMIWNENMMYTTPRSMRKMNIIDEGWKLLGGSSTKIKNFIEEGYRTARRHNGSYGTVTQAIRDKNLSTAALAAYDNSSFKFTCMQDAKSFSTFEKEEPHAFNELEWMMIRKFPPAKKARYSSFLLSVGEYSSFHRLLLDPLSDGLFSSKGEDFTFREKRLKEGADIKDILFEMTENDPHKRSIITDLRGMAL
ncbi:type IV secretion system protein TraC [Candidatus Pantoea multigeneris]|uniref:Type IV secretion system protein TraC n=1 Tax=Candidatus Pantoea multigeneris TaxID=2608357 RepID=A0ABX0REX9_9GAMM|nr:type IV secretion system protein TraC [Pantoea multigeneris]NIF23917.1 type IV secretion system protein TraC [Pantoea multigeneris]